jgi:hypothetical protein
VGAMTRSNATDAHSLFAEIEERLEPGREWASARERLQELFSTGRVPEPAPDGFMSGRALLLSVWEPADVLARRIAGAYKRWEGKRFDRSRGRGVNVLRPPRLRAASSERVERFPFETRVAPAASDRGLQVLAIDYDIPDNPRWVRTVLDEVVEVAPGCLLGKIHLRWGSTAYPVGFFALQA